jgi:hypothetical protein
MQTHAHAHAVHRRRPDRAYASTDRIVHLEVDGRSHVGGSVLCGLSKLDGTNYGVADRKRPTVFLRFNLGGTRTAATGCGSFGKTMAARQLPSCAPTPTRNAGRW